MDIEHTIISADPRLSDAEIEKEYARTIFDFYCSPTSLFDIQRDFIEHLPGKEYRLLSQIHSMGGAYGANFQDILLNSHCGNYTTITYHFSTALYYYFLGGIRYFTLNDLMSNTKIGPYAARIFVCRITEHDNTIRRNIRLLGKTELEWLRSFGYHVPTRITRHNYWKLEQTYLHGDFKI
jgi:hypothetical protein